MDYTIGDDTFTVSIIEADAVILEQSIWPSGEAFSSYAEAEGWAIATIESFAPEATHFAPTAPGVEGLPKPTQIDLNAYNAIENISSSQDWNQGIEQFCGNTLPFRIHSLEYEHKS